MNVRFCIRIALGWSNARQQTSFPGIPPSKEGLFTKICRLGCMYRCPLIEGAYRHMHASPYYKPAPFRELKLLASQKTQKPSSYSALCHFSLSLLYCSSVFTFLGYPLGIFMFITKPSLWPNLQSRPLCSTVLSRAPTLTSKVFHTPQSSNFFLCC